MPAPRLLRCYGEGHLALVGPDATRLDIDPRLPDDDREAAVEALPADVIALTQGGAGLDDALDLLERWPTAILLAAPRLCDQAARELDLADRLVDLEPGDRIKLPGLRLAALGSAGGGLPGLPLLDRLPDPRDLLGGVGLTRGLEGLPVVGALARPAEGLLGGAHRQGLLVELEGGPSLLLAADNLVDGRAERFLDALDEDEEIDVLVAAVRGEDVGALVRAVRRLEPGRVVLYRDQDPYAGRGPVLPIDRFVAALREDQPTLKVVVLRAGEELDLQGAPA